MQFSPITLQAREVIFPRIYRDDKAICDLSFTNLYGWSERYETSWTLFEDDIVIIRFRSAQRSHPVFLLPYCSDRAQWQRTVVALINYAEENNFPLVCMGVTEDCAGSVQETFPHEFVAFWDEDYTDYVYLRENLISLSGKKLQPKRNHINKFRKLYPEHHYKPFTLSDVDAYKAFADRWMAVSDPIDGLREENRMIHRILDAAKELELLGGALFVEDEMVAITLGSPINYNTFDVHVEKALSHINGAYTVINKLFASHIPEQYTYINREEDLGLPGLRFAKSSYQPFCKLSKGTVLHRRNSDETVSL